ncbi:MAG: hypothetical protein IKH57_05590 [Clostridia bacterium]|nr:hypothetical protein [Clostridia bacterium]
MSDQEKREQEIMNQEMSQDEMETVAGGLGDDYLDDDGLPSYSCLCQHHETVCNSKNSIKHGRLINRPDGSTNCAATVEDGSWCGSNDACYEDEVNYMGLNDCAKAWN